MLVQRDAAVIADVVGARNPYAAAKPDPLAAVITTDLVLKKDGVRLI